MNELIKIIQYCSFCGFCEFECPVYNKFRKRWLSPRGRIYFAKKLLIDRKLIITDCVIESFYTCIQCGNCINHCPLKINIPKIVSICKIIINKVLNM